jgi:hypothetical protein
MRPPRLLLEFGSEPARVRAEVYRLKLLCLMVAAGFALSGCSDDEKTEKPPEPPVLKLVGVRPALATSALVKEGCVSLGPDPDHTVFVRVALENFTLRPPGACRGASACGSVQITFAGANRFSAVSSLATAGVPFGANPEGAYDVSVALLDDNGELVTPSPCSRGACKIEGALRFVRSCDGKPPAEPSDAGETTPPPVNTSDAGAVIPPRDSGPTTPDGGAAAMPSDASTPSDVDGRQGAFTGE